MTRIKQAGPSVLAVALIAGIIGYILGCTRSQRESDSQANASQVNKAVDKIDQQANPSGARPSGKPDPRKTYYPNTEKLAENEMRVISLGTGMPNQRKSQASACWLVE